MDREIIVGIVIIGVMVIQTLFLMIGVRVMFDNIYRKKKGKKDDADKR